MSDVDSYVPSTLPRRSQSWPAVTEALSERELIYMTPDLDDHDGIVAAVQAYVDGFNDRDPEKFKRAFYEDAWMYCIDEAGTLQKMPLDDEQFEVLGERRDDRCRIASAVRSPDGRRRLCRPCLGN